jgi:hypothetical protein
MAVQYWTIRKESERSYACNGLFVVTQSARERLTFLSRLPYAKCFSHQPEVRLSILSDDFQPIPHAHLREIDPANGVSQCRLISASAADRIARSSFCTRSQTFCNSSAMRANLARCSRSILVIAFPSFRSRVETETTAGSESNVSNIVNSFVMGHHGNAISNDDVVSERGFGHFLSFQEILLCLAATSSSSG